MAGAGVDVETYDTQLEKVELERIRVLYRNARFSIVGVLISTFFYSFFLWHNVDGDIWLTWVAAILAVNLPRLLLIERFFKRLSRQLITAKGIAAWEGRFYIGVVFSALSWTAVTLFPFRGDVLLSLVYTALALIALSSASIVTLITSLKMGLTFLSLTILPLIARFLLEGTAPFYILAAVCLTYYVIFTQMACRLHYAIIDNIYLKFENEELSLKDALTGLWNRRQLYLFIAQQQSRVARTGEGFSVILMDLDYFKRYNDSQGHNAGDALLVKVAEILRDESRDIDLAVRYGGEEFLVVLPRAESGQALQVAERIRSEVERQTDITISGGIAEYRPAESFEAVMARADQALYLAKSYGRNRVSVHEGAGGGGA